MTNSTTSKELRSEIFRWWERGITYPRLFKDRNNDGIRDLEGIRSKLASMPFPQFDALVADLPRRGMKILLDYVPNHTSDRHPCFIEARAPRARAKRDWYIWRDLAPGGGAPNNWRSNFGGSAWQWDDANEGLVTELL